ncbi:xylosidase/arabinosidase [Colletotrichum spaethianum]|uniref:Xylosidase/arabinosidase n=1 Tax=Colletotrichum spaethianum TaxID=700344 RepID=A0AA37NV96_9PEZI|nr:xylosidase/arabinosidase [Colletotrichum spaethianum]GKT43012.1 xylosidase/arabinosidase [Colletotrichum spaethianum]
MLGYMIALTPALLLLGALFDGAGLARANNPIVQTIYTTDPAPLVYNNRVYVFTGHDEDGSTGFNMRDWRAYSTSDMVNWQDHGVMASLATFSWANANAWAGQVIPRNGRFYFYVPIRRTTGSMAIGVAVSDSITGPYRDALGKPLVDNNEIDPTVFIDDNGQAYLYWGNPKLSYVRLNQDMISYSGGVNRVTLTPQGFGARTSGHLLMRKVLGSTSAVRLATWFTPPTAARKTSDIQPHPRLPDPGRTVGW